MITTSLESTISHITTTPPHSISPQQCDLRWHNPLANWSANPHNSYRHRLQYSNTNSNMINQKTRCWQIGNILTIHLHIVFIGSHYLHIHSYRACNWRLDTNRTQRHTFCEDIKRAAFCHVHRANNINGTSVSVHRLQSCLSQWHVHLPGSGLQHY